MLQMYKQSRKLHIKVNLKLHLICAIGCTLLSACRTQYVTQEVPVVVEHTSTEKHTELRVDTIHTRDSTFVLIKGDTLIERHYNTIYKERNVIIRDTVTDSIPVPVEVVRTQVQHVERPRRWWESALMWLGGIAATLAAAAVAWAVWRVTLVWIRPRTA